ncbi:MAG: Uxx-star family glutaredoxin-like (seleno)protein [Candidatus Aenigmatarchaeota archaeon]
MTVKVYTTSVCPYCNFAKDFLRENNVKFEEINVQLDRSAAEEMIKKTGQMAVPVIEIDGKIIVGFNKEAIKKALKLK